MGVTDNKRIVQAFYDAANRGDTEGFLSQLADDVTWTNIGSTKYSGTYVGKNDLVAKLVKPLFGQLKAGIACTIHKIIAEADFVVVQLSGRSETKDGRPYNNTYCHVFRIRDGKIGEVTEYFDTELVTAVFGAWRATPQDSAA
jgi:ketosteroid isomerase-like protein